MCTMKKIMILGAGVYQVPLIKKAKELGLETLVVSYPGPYPGFSISDRNIYEDTTNFETLTKIGAAENIDGVCTTGTDVALISLGVMCETLGLVGPSVHAVRLSTDKKKMKEAFLNHGVRTARYIEVSSLEDCHSAFEKLHAPVIFKAVDSSGSRGIIRVNDKNDIEKAYEHVANVTKKDYFIIEEYITGEEFGAQAFVRDKELLFNMPHGDMVFQGNTGVPVGHFVPYKIDDAIITDARVQLTKAIHALNLDNCAINADFILQGNEVFVLEIGARAGATCLAEMVGIHYKFDYFEYLIRASLGEDMSVEFTNFVPCAGELLMAEKTGILKEIRNMNPPAPHIHDISFDYRPGDTVRKFQVGPDRIGQVVVDGKSVKAALSNLESVKRNIAILIE